MNKPLFNFEWSKSLESINIRNVVRILKRILTYKKL